MTRSEVGQTGELIINKVQHIISTATDPNVVKRYIKPCSHNFLISECYSLVI